MAHVEQPLAVTCEAIEVIALSIDGLLPGKVGEDSGACQPRTEFVCRHLPPENDTEETLLSMWVNTHQAMFISTGIAAQCVCDIRAMILALAPLDEVRDMVQLAVSARLSSAAYTSLPFLTKELYEAYVRQSMMTVHPGFSGVSNQEAITMELCLRELKAEHQLVAETNRDYARALQSDLDEIYSADREWWKYHGEAMRKYVTDPTSLARLDYRKQQTEGSGDHSFQDYRDRVLRQSGAVADYDRYFAVRRKDGLTTEHYRQLLEVALERSDPYVETSGLLADYRKQGQSAFRQILDLHS